MNNFKFLQSIIIIAVVSLTLGLILFIESSINNYDQVNTNWTSYSNTETRIVESLLILNDRLGYGGMIHHFKNYVIRGDDKYLSLFKQDTSEIKHQLEKIKELYAQSQKSQRSDIVLSTIKMTVIQYEKQLAIAREMHTTQIAIDKIDSLVKVDDAMAIQALTTLRDEIEERSIAVQQETDMALSKAHNTLSNGRLFSIPILLLLFLLIYYIRRVQTSNQELIESHNWVDTLLDTAPEATICSNAQGQIVRVNQQAENLFGFSQEELLSMDIEQLVPEQYSDVHGSHRADFFKNQSYRPMDDNTNLYALLKDGSEIEVAISLSLAGAGKDRTAIAMIKDVTEMRRASRMLSHQASHDGLTGLINRVEAEKIFAKEIDRAKRYNRSLSIFMIDIDHFKSVNDTYGHSLGDKVLKIFANNLIKIMRKTDFNARFGGEEFVVILPETTCSDATTLAERLRKSIEETVIQESEAQLSVTASIGVASYPENGDNFQNLLNEADGALYKAKNNGRNRVEVA